MKNLNKWIMHLSAFVNGITGIVISFFPRETGKLINTSSQSGTDLLLIKLIGATLFGYGVMNFLARNSVIGGIYGKPMVIGNMIFHLIVGGQLLKFIAGGSAAIPLIPAAVIYTLLAAGFLRMNFTSPV